MFGLPQPKRNERIELTHIDEYIISVIRFGSHSGVFGGGSNRVGYAFAALWWASLHARATVVRIARAWSPSGVGELRKQYGRGPHRFIIEKRMDEG